MERTEENNATKDRFAHVGKIFSEMDSEKLQAEIAERSKIIKRKINRCIDGIAYVRYLTKTVEVGFSIVNKYFNSREFV